MLNFLLCLSILFLFLPVFSNVQCTELFSSSSVASKNLVERVRSWRKTELQWTDVKWIQVHQVYYEVQGILGRGSSKVYLAVGPDGRQVSIKVIENDSEQWLNSIYYEIEATKFYLQKGEPVPQVIDFEVKWSEQLGGMVGVLVKEYRLGLTRDELEYLIDLDPSLWAKQVRLLAILESERRRLKKLHQQQFALWLKENKIKLKPFVKLSRFEQEGDTSVDHDNFLFDIERGRWIIFDP